LGLDDKEIVFLIQLILVNQLRNLKQ